ncbi:uncharacterized protein PHALS_06776 [Plasmopara halstedii]|uniref:Uncharacterized protein n=1 Tax=Plasmopara halstedii TaxID=4781 RepID=A0A0P1B4V3_PLAHL|nr:uncharacterized protein PHALS_06776 [Plasmopara halstedii]CEG48986.1 hypothetical protein PHALS_06776 [Plasmopara halstedii]|eukprot:XP_024585355.1 hypothetical protein PHALS_06776 [Plasmopara halstedii]
MSAKVNATSAHPNRIHTNNQSTPASYNQKHDIQKHLALIQTLLVQPTFDSNQNEKNTIVVSKFNHPLTRSSHALYTRHSATVKNNFVEFNASTMQYTTDATSAGIRVRARRHTTIRNENMKLKTRILNTQATIDPIVLKRHEENHLAMRRIRSRHQIKKKSSRF